LPAGGWPRRGWLAAGVQWAPALGSVAAATLVTLWLRKYLQPDPAAPLHVALYFCAILFSSWQGGVGPGILAALLSVAAIKYYCSPPFHTFTMAGSELPRFGTLLVTGLFISWLTGRQKRAEAALRQAQEELAQKVLTRTLELQEKTRQLENTNLALEQDLAGRKLMAASLQRLNRLYAFSSSVNEVIIRFHDPQELYKRACQVAVDQCGFVMAWVGLVEPGGDRLRLVAHAGPEEGYLSGLQVSVQPGPLGCGTAGRAYREDGVVCCNDVATDPHLQPWRDEALKRGYHSCASVPLKMAGEPLGVFMVYAGQPGFFGAEELQSLEALGDNLAFAIESHQTEQQRVRAEAAVRDSNRQLQSLAARLQSLQEEERTRIAREIHDELGQLLTGLKMGYRAMEQELERLGDPRLNPILEKAVSAAEITDVLAKSVQHIATELRPAMLDRLGLVMALTREAELFQQHTGIPCRFKAPEAEPPMPVEAATALYRICQEALTNVGRHAGATRVEIELQAPSGLLTLEIRDNGKGIPGANLSGNHSLGLLGMKERARQLGGEVAFNAGATGGTVVTVKIPNPQPQELPHA